MFKERPSKVSLAERSMSVQVGTQGGFGIIEVHAAKPLKADAVCEFIPEGRVALGGGQVNACGIGVASVDADGATLVADQLQKTLEFLQAFPCTVALPRCVLDDGNDSGGFGKSLPNALCDGLEGVLEVGSQAASWVEIQIFEPEFFHALEFGDKGGGGVLALFGRGVAQIDEIGVMG